MLGAVSAAVVGTPIARREVGRPGSGAFGWWDATYDYTLRVERSYKRRLGPTIVVRAGGSPAACETQLTIGRRTGLLLGRGPEPYEVGLCSLIEPRELEAAARPMPRPRGAGRLALLGGGRFSTARLMGWNRRGTLLGYGFGGGTTNALSVCPGGRRVVELVSFSSRRSRGGTYAMVRRVSDLAVVRSLSLRDGIDVACLSPEGSDLLAAIAPADYERTRLVRVRGRRRTAQAPIRGNEVTSGGGMAYVSTESGLVALDPVTDARRTVTQAARNTEGMAVSPDGGALAAIPFVGEGVPRLELVDLASGRVRRVRLRESEPGLPVWLGSRRVALVEGAGGSASVFRRDGARIPRARAPGTYRALERVLQPNLVALVGLPAEPTVRVGARRPPPFAGAAARRCTWTWPPP